MSATIRVSEIFGPTLQGEGILIGQPTVFVRTGGCDYRCSWCDTMHAVDSSYRDQWVPMSAQDIFAKVQHLSNNKPVMVSLSGGNPAIQDLKPLIDIGHEAGYEFALETQGSIAQDWFASLDVLTLSPKPPSSGMTTDWSVFDDCLSRSGPKTQSILKIVVFDEGDYQYAKNAAQKYSQYPIYLQPGNHSFDEKEEPDTEGLHDRLLWLTDRVLQDGWFDVTVLPQLHVMMWGNKRGV